MLMPSQSKTDDKKLGRRVNADGGKPWRVGGCSMQCKGLGKGAQARDAKRFKRQKLTIKNIGHFKNKRDQKNKTFCPKWITTKPN